MLAIRTLFVAISTIQTEAENPFPRVTARIALAAQPFVPVFLLLRSVLPSDTGLSTIVVAASISLLLILPPTYSKTIQEVEIDDNWERIKTAIAVLLFASVVPMAVIARYSAGYALATYLVFASLPLQKWLNIKLR